eukprot:116779-Amphidinium_carterae.1
MKNLAKYPNIDVEASRLEAQLKDYIFMKKQTVHPLWNLCLGVHYIYIMKGSHEQVSTFTLRKAQIQLTKLKSQLLHCCPQQMLNFAACAEEMVERPSEGRV